MSGPQRRALITGLLGFCGRHLCAHLAEQGYAVAGIDRVLGSAPAQATLFTADIADTRALHGILCAVQPTHIFHLAALTAPHAPWEALHQANIVGTASLLGAVRLAHLEPAILVVGSSAAYGRVEPHELPISEAQPLRPANLYAVSKVAQEMVAHAHYAQHGLNVIRARAFNLTGPGESPSFVTSAFARQVAEIEAGLHQPVVEVGNLEAVRDFTDARDAVRAYRLLAELGRPGEVYNVCSGRGIAIRHVLDRLLVLSSRAGIAVTVSPARLQPADVPAQVGDASRLSAATGWTPEIPFERTLRDLLDAWRERLGVRPDPAGPQHRMAREA